MTEFLTTRKGQMVKVDEQKFVAQKGNEQWEGSEVQVESTPLMDPNMGEAKVIRNFLFKFNPEFLHKNPKLKGINKQELFNGHWKYLQIELWKDGLVEDESITPKITFKQEYYIIQITCRPKFGVSVIETPKSLNDYLKPKKGA